MIQYKHHGGKVAHMQPATECEVNLSQGLVHPRARSEGKIRFKTCLV